MNILCIDEYEAVILVQVTVDYIYGCGGCDGRAEYIVNELR